MACVGVGACYHATYEIQVRNFMGTGRRFIREHGGIRWRGRYRAHPVAEYEVLGLRPFCRNCDRELGQIAESSLVMRGFKCEVSPIKMDTPGGPEVAIE